MGRVAKVSNKEHRYAAQNLSAYLDSELSPQEAQRVKQHVQGCSACQRELDELRAMVELVRRVPVQPAARSFTLPLSAQPAQASHRRWNTTYTLMRGAMVAAVAMLVLSFGVDSLLRTGVVPSAGASPALESQVAMSLPETAVTQVVEAAVMREVQAAPNEPMVAASAPALEGLANEGPVGNAGADSEVPGEATEQSVDALVAPTLEWGEAPPDVGASGPVAPSMRQGEDQPSSDVVGAGAPELSVEAEMQSDAGVAEQYPTLSEAETAIVSAALAEQQRAEEGMRGAESLHPAAEPAIASQAPVTERRAGVGVWAAWEIVRLLMYVLAGLVLILGAGLLWAGHKSRA